jgi:lipid A 4'-phosphatase
MQGTSMTYWLKHFWALPLLVVMQLLFLNVPAIDLQVSAWFFESPRGFVLADWPPGAWLTVTLETLPFLLIPVLAWLMFASAYWNKKGEKDLRRRLLFLILLLALGPVLLANLLASESGRAKPVAIEAFGGQKAMTAAFEPAGECRADCAFVSPAAAAAFALIGLAWVLRDRHWIAYGLAAGALVGGVEVSAGQRYLSDILFAFWLVYGIAFAMARITLKRTS